MIASLRGTVIHKNTETIEIDISGLGYETYCPKSVLSQVNSGEDVELFTYHQVTENSNNLYGFLSRNNKKVFETLISVSGIGPKMALAVFDIGSGKQIYNAIAKADVEFFKQVKGIGNKSAQRIIVDLKSKVGSIKELDLESSGEENNVVYEALTNLGFRRQEIREALIDLPKEIISDNQKVKYVLQKLGK